MWPAELQYYSTYSRSGGGGRSTTGSTARKNGGGGGSYVIISGILSSQTTRRYGILKQNGTRWVVCGRRTSKGYRKHYVTFWMISYYLERGKRKIWMNPCYNYQGIHKCPPTRRRVYEATYLRTASLRYTHDTYFTHTYMPTVQQAEWKAQRQTWAKNSREAHTYIHAVHHVSASRTNKLS